MNSEKIYSFLKLLKHPHPNVRLLAVKNLGKLKNSALLDAISKFAAGIPEMQQVGRWKSKDMLAYYARDIEAENDAVARYKYGKGS